MRVTSLLLFAAAALADIYANRVTFINQDDIPRTVYFTPSVDLGCIQVPPLHIGPYKAVTQGFPEEWQGMWFAQKQGEPQRVGMLGEVRFDGYEGKTFFDVSGIDSPGDWHNVKKLYPAQSKEPSSGCDVFWCDNAYWAPNDVQTKVTDEKHLVQTLGDRPADRQAYAAMGITREKRSIGEKFNKAVVRAEQEK
ncbi:hypothetical protein QBC38DRAFT_206504 [Podospora fimiseda]|uniref:DNase1 protein n=1 Tax=Podospora fimiseda TaxID=252190 RepID=A0AAN7H449_9PEZI|nr:hypothetical protein QBC38DRAFT_206504 [Podospora fimiseda]